VSLAVTEVGTGDRLVVFVHGVLGHGRSFDRVAALLDEECTMRWYDRYGRCDEQVMHEVTAFLGERIPQFEVVTIPGAGHHAHRTAPHRTAPDAFADLVRRGLDRR
jgi:hypothetical protein